MSIENPKTTKEGLPKEELQKYLEEAEFRKEEAREFSIPENVNFSAFGEAEDGVARAYEKLSEWLKIPYAFDNFGDNHDARRKWRHKFDETEFSEEIRRSKMRANVYARPALLITVLLTDLKKAGSKHRELTESIKNAWSPVPNLIAQLEETKDTQQRKALLENMEDAVVEVLNLIAEAADTDNS